MPIAITETCADVVPRCRPPPSPAVIATPHRVRGAAGLPDASIGQGDSNSVDSGATGCWRRSTCRSCLVVADYLSSDRRWPAGMPSRRSPATSRSSSAPSTCSAASWPPPAGNGRCRQCAGSAATSCGASCSRPTARRPRARRATRSRSHRSSVPPSRRRVLLDAASAPSPPKLRSTWPGRERAIVDLLAHCGPRVSCTSEVVAIAGCQSQPIDRNLRYMRMHASTMVARAAG